jgi:hypothetical protein
VRVVEFLRAKSSEYELLAEWHAERAPFDNQHRVASPGHARRRHRPGEMAEAIDVEWRRRPMRSDTASRS